MEKAERMPAPAAAGKEELAEVLAETTEAPELVPPATLLVSL